MLKNVTISAALFLIFVVCSSVFAEGDLSGTGQPPAEGEKKEQEQLNSRNVNVDMQLAYGQYNNMFSTISLSHEREDFAYLLTSNFKKSNDYGYGGKTYANTSYYENKMGFTGNFSVTDSWKTLFEAAVDNDSHGMYANPVYTREEKDKYSLSVKSTVRSSTSVEWYSTLSYSGYTHRLSGRSDADNEKGSLDKIRGEFGGEYVWSGSNRIRGSLQAVYYDYSLSSVPNDCYVKGEVVDDFKLTSSTGVSVGSESCWDRDGGMLTLLSPVPFNPFVALSYTAAKYLTMSLSYKYDMENFRPENIFFDQKYVHPRFDLAPSQSHIGEGKIGIHAGDIFTLKSTLTAKKNDNFYNYYNYFEGSSVNGNVLSVRGINAVSVDAKTDATLSVPDSGFQITTEYEYQWFHASENITYHPDHQVSVGLKYGSSQWNIEWSNRFFSSVFTDPSADRKLPRSVVGLVGVQIQLVSGLLGYLRVENIYNNRYYLREGYPEAGITFLGGLRILI